MINNDLLYSNNSMAKYCPFKNSRRYENITDSEIKGTGGGGRLAAKTITALVKLKQMSNISIWNMYRVWT